MRGEQQMDCWNCKNRHTDKCKACNDLYRDSAGVNHHALYEASTQALSDNAVILEIIRDRERLGRASRYITDERIRCEAFIRSLSMIITRYTPKSLPLWISVLLDEEREHLAALVAAEKEVAEHE